MPDPVPPPDAVRLTALAATLAWALGVAALLQAPRAVARPIWLAAWLVALAHVLTAFALAHGWSHAAAVAHTERASGFGFGVYVNELFLLAWLADALWRLCGPPPKWWTWAAHGFLAFIVFNAAVAFGSWPARGVGAACFAALALLLSKRLSGKMSPAAHPPPRPEVTP